MRAFIIAVCILLAIAYVSAVPINADVHRQFYEFQVKYQKTYATESERAYRVEVFAENLKKAEILQAQNDMAVFGVTKFSDLTAEEFKRMYLNLQLPIEMPAETYVFNSSLDTPAAWDWRTDATPGVEKGKVITPVKNQQQCGSCWAFSATESIESAWVIAKHEQKILSPQQLVDCDKSSAGCNGGNPEGAFKYVIQAGGQMSAAAYPYEAKDGPCKFKKEDAVAQIKSYKMVSNGASTEDQMAPALAASGPLSVMLDASSWQNYQSGVLRTCGNQIDHAVQATGYSENNGVKVWHVRNSWGADWGQNGYILLERGKNLCNIAAGAAIAEA